MSLRRIRLVAMVFGALQLARFSDERYAIDDAWISFRTARTLIEGGGLTFDSTQPPVEGVTNLLWTLLSAGGLWLAPDLEPGVVARSLGGLCLLGVLWLAVGLAADLAESVRAGTGGVAALTTALVLGSAGNVAYHALSGLESGFYLLLWTGALAAGLGSTGRTPKASLWVGVLLFALAMTRPEGVLLGALTFALLASIHGVGAAIPGVALWTTGVIGLELFRLAYFGELVPNTFFAKPPSAHLGWSYLMNFALAVGAIGPLAALFAGWHSKILRGLLGIAAVLLAGVVWSGGDWMAGFRRLLDVYLVLAVGAGIGVALDWRARVPAVAMILSSVFLAVDKGDSARYGLQTYGRVGALLAVTPGVDTVAALDIGRLGWYFPGSIVDLAGLTDKRWARASTDAERRAYFAERSPDVVLLVTRVAMTPSLISAPGLRPGEEQVLGWIRQDRSYSLRQVIPLPGGTHMAVLVRNDLVLPVALWNAAP